MSHFSFDFDFFFFIWTFLLVFIGGAGGDGVFLASNGSLPYKERKYHNDISWKPNYNY